MMSFRRPLAYAVIALTIACSAAPADTRVTYLQFSSAPNTVGLGRTNYKITPEDGWQFIPLGNVPNGVSFQIVKGEHEEFWFLDLSAAPLYTPITPGTYLDVERFMVGSFDKPGLTFSGNGLGVNSVAGEFKVFEAKLGPANVMDQFSVDFLQYDEGDPERWVAGKLRFNALEVPEPSGFAACGVALIALTWRSRRLRRPQG